MVLLLFFLYFSIVQYIRIVVEPLEKNAPHLAISRLRDALSYKAVNSFIAKGAHERPLVKLFWRELTNFSGQWFPKASRVAMES